MVGFEYYGNSTETILDSSPLILVAYSQIESLGSNRSKMEGERSISRPITNEYGTLYEPLSFSYALMKQDEDVFTEEEQIKVESWLTSPKLSTELKFTDCKGSMYSYFGLFTNTAWVRADGGYVICEFTFQVNGSHAYRYFELHGTSNVYDNEGNYTGNDGQLRLQFDCQTDEYEEYVYPIIDVTASSLDYDSSFTLTNVTDESRQVQITTRRATTMRLDCQNNMIGEYAKGVVSDVYINLLRYKDVGWNDIGNIYWPRFKVGTNIIDIEGNVDVDVMFYTPYKKIGGWLI